jgi:hypothetical protein
MIILQGLGQNTAVVVPLQKPASGSKKNIPVVSITNPEVRKRTTESYQPTTTEEDNKKVEGRLS